MIVPPDSRDADNDSAMSFASWTSRSARGCTPARWRPIDCKVRRTAVHIGARVMAAAKPSEVLVSSTVKDLVAGSGLVLENAGEHELKGVSERWRLYRVEGP